MLLESMPYLMKQQQRPMMAGPGGQRGYSQGGHPKGQMRPNNRGYNQGGQMGGNRMHTGQMSGGGQAQMQMGAGGPNPAAQQHMAQQNQQQQMMMQQQQQQQQQQQMQQMNIDQRYLMTCHSIINAVVPENPNYKD